MAAMEVEEQAEFKTFEPMPGLGEKPEKKNRYIHSMSR